MNSTIAAMMTTRVPGDLNWRPAVEGPWFVPMAAALVTLGTLPQFLVPPIPDVSWLLYVAGRMLEGERLYVDLIEVNPPLIVWLNLPVAWLARRIGLPDALVYRSLVVLGAIGSLLLSRIALRRLRQPSDPVMQRLLLLLVGTALLPLAGIDFGEREHLLFILALPYVFLAAVRWEGAPVAPAFALAVGVLAGIGIALKPYFVLLPLVVEAGRWPIRPRQIVRPETVAIVSVCVAYIAAVHLWAGPYWKLAAEMGAAYYRFLREPLLVTALAGEGAGVALCSVLASVALRHRRRENALATVLLLATLGLYASAVLQQKGWRYHFYPSMGTGLLLLAVLSIPIKGPVLSFAGRVYQAVAVALIFYLPGLLIGSAALRMTHPVDGPMAGDPDYPRLAELVRREVPGGSVLALSSNMASAFPLLTPA